MGMRPDQRHQEAAQACRVVVATVVAVIVVVIMVVAAIMTMIGVAVPVL
jgi:CHASE3 domain sensor protein